MSESNASTATVDVEVLPMDDKTTNASPAESSAKPKTKSSVAQKQAIRNRAEEFRLQAGQDREDLNTYTEAGPFYASRPPVANSIGGEVGFSTKNKETGKIQRSGVGFYIRCDHIGNCEFDMPLNPAV